MFYLIKASRVSDQRLFLQKWHSVSHKVDVFKLTFHQRQAGLSSEQVAFLCFSLVFMDRNEGSWSKLHFLFQVKPKVCCACALPLSPRELSGNLPLFSWHWIRFWCLLKIVFCGFMVKFCRVTVRGRARERARPGNDFPLFSAGGRASSAARRTDHDRGFIVFSF